MTARESSPELSVTEVADVTGFPEMLDGRIKTLHPKMVNLYAGCDRDLSP